MTSLSCSFAVDSSVMQCAPVKCLQAIEIIGLGDFPLYVHNAHDVSWDRALHFAAPYISLRLTFCSCLVY